MPQFQRFSHPHVRFETFNIENNDRSILTYASKSSTPIGAVPKFILYIGGVPKSEYTGERTQKGVFTFIGQMMAYLQNAGMGRAAAGTGTTQLSVPPAQQQYPQMAPAQGPQSIMPPPSVAGQGSMGGGAPAPQPNIRITPNTGVKEYEMSYGIPFNMTNEQDYLTWMQHNGRKQ